jgi:hypothetical protein
VPSLISLLLVLLLAGTLPAKPQECCDPAQAGQCHHPQPLRQNTPCEPQFSACPDAGCIEQRQGVASAAVATTPLAIETPRAARSEAQPMAGGSPAECYRAPDRTIDSKLFLRTHKLVI